METKQIPYIIYAESTPNPVSIKFVANKMLLPGSSYESDDPNGNAASPLAERLFNFSFVQKVYITNNFVSVTKTESIEWEDVVHQLREFVADYLNNGGLVMNEAMDSDSLETASNEYIAVKEHRDPKNDTEKNIIGILDEYVKPAVENDGGAILFDSYDDGKVNLILKGSCSGCPSSVMTLKSGVENLLKQMMPNEVKEVVAVNG